jgi:hypothetical protein
MRCEGWHRYGGAFSFGPVKWVQCENEAVVELLVEQDGKEKLWPACLTCWKEAVANKMKIIQAFPIEYAPDAKEEG